MQYVPHGAETSSLRFPLHGASVVPFTMCQIYSIEL